MERECEAFVAACEHCGGTRSQPTIGAEPGVAPTPSTPFQGDKDAESAAIIADRSATVLLLGRRRPAIARAGQSPSACDDEREHKKRTP